MNQQVKYYTLSNGLQIPEIGFGTWQTPSGETAVNAVRSALENGYRHIDTAAAYGNEESVGRAIKQSGINRDAVFITTKVWNTERGYESTLKAFEKSLNKLSLDYLDLYLIHWPANAKSFVNWKDINTQTWQALEKLYTEGKVKAIGVSNFMVNHLEALLETAEIKPMVNQIEYHPGYTQNEVVELSKNHQMLVEAWSPLGTGKMLTNPQLKEIAGRYHISVAQLCIRWCLQNEVLPLPKSVTPERIKQNFEVYGFEISEEDMKAINGMLYIGGSGLNPNEVNF